MERYHRFRLEHILIRSRRRPPQAATKTEIEIASDEDPDTTVAPVGMEGPRAEIVTLLMKPKGDDEKELRQLKVVSILGVEGVGKSRLAQELWRFLGEDQLECRAFVKASKKPNMRMILRSILVQVRPNQQLSEACRVPDLIHDITKHLQDKRFYFFLLLGPIHIYHLILCRIYCFISLIFFIGLWQTSLSTRAPARAN